MRNNALCFVANPCQDEKTVKVDFQLAYSDYEWLYGAKNVEKGGNAFQVSLGRYDCAIIVLRR